MLEIAQGESTGSVFNWGNLFLVTSQVDNAQFIANSFHQEFENHKNLSPFNVLKETIETTKTTFANQIANLEVVAVYFVDGVVYCATSGGGKITITRDGAEATILEGKANTSTVASGYPKLGDSINLTTSSSSLSLNFNDQKEMVINAPPDLPTEIKTPNPLSKITDSLKGFKFKLPNPKIYVKQTPEFEMESQGKKTTMSIGIVLLLILVVSIGFGIRQKNIKEAKAQYQDVLIAANKDLDEALGLVDVSPDKAREFFVLAQEKLGQIESYADKDPEITKLKEKIESQKSEAFKEYKVTPELFSDLTLLSSGFSGDKMTASEGTIYILDKNGQKVVSIGIENKKSKVVAGGDSVGDTQDLASYSDRAFTLTEDGINEVDNTSTQVIEKDWEGQSLIYGFAGNIYVLDKQEGLIYRFAGSGSSFGSRQNWLASSVDADFNSVKAWNIDGAVYVLNSNGKILKYSLGSPQVFSLTGVFPSLTNIDAIFSNDESEFFYILDTQNKRVVVTDKKGSYKAQYTGEGIGQAKGLVVSEKEGKILLLTGDKLLVIEIKS